MQTRMLKYRTGRAGATCQRVNHPVLSPSKQSDRLGNQPNNRPPFAEVCFSNNRIPQKRTKITIILVLPVKTVTRAQALTPQVTAGRPGGETRDRAASV